MHKRILRIINIVLNNVYCYMFRHLYVIPGDFFFFFTFAPPKVKKILKIALVKITFL